MIHKLFFALFGSIMVFIFFMRCIIKLLADSVSGLSFQLMNELFFYFKSIQWILWIFFARVSQCNVSTTFSIQFNFLLLSEKQLKCSFFDFQWIFYNFYFLNICNMILNGLVLINRWQLTIDGKFHKSSSSLGRTSSALLILILNLA